MVKIGNTGANGTPHLTLVDLAAAERIEIEHVPFRGEGDAAELRDNTGHQREEAEGRHAPLVYWLRRREVRSAFRCANFLRGAPGARATTIP